MRIARSGAALEPGLHIVSTPIGNLRDITLRALDTLAGADYVLAEDTRVARKLLDAYSLNPTLRPYHDHNGEKARPGILADLEKGMRIALISDAGTPLVSDPGFKLVREALAAGAHVVAAPGASAPLAALTVSGLPSDRFLFVGFPPSKQAARRRFLADIADIKATLIFFEGGSRIGESLSDMAEVLGDRPAALARELTKRFEEVRRERLSALAAAIADGWSPRGEIVIVVGPPGEAGEVSADDLDSALREALSRVALKTAAAEVAGRLGLKKRDVYARAVQMRDEELREDGGDA